MVLEYEMGIGVERLLYNLLSSCEIDPDAAAIFLRMPKDKLNYAFNTLSEAIDNHKHLNTR